MLCHVPFQPLTKNSLDHSQNAALSCLDNLQHSGQPALNTDFPNLFDSTPEWSAQTDVFAITPLKGSIVGPEDALRSINAFLIRHRIALAVGIGAAQLDNANPVPGECGVGVEGLTRPNRNAIYFKRLRRLGIDVRHIVMDEPLTFAHYYSGKGACQYSIQDTARRVGLSIAEIKEFYPNAQIVDYEAPSATSPQQWTADLPIWLSEYHKVTGIPLHAVVFDVNWKLPWLEWVKPSVAVLQKYKIRTGMILTGAGPGASDARAMAAYVTNALSVDAAMLPFDLVVIANWTAHPSRNLPESDPNALTWFLRWYEARHGRAK